MAVDGFTTACLWGWTLPGDEGRETGAGASLCAWDEGRGDGGRGDGGVIDKAGGVR